MSDISNIKRIELYKLIKNKNDSSKNAIFKVHFNEANDNKNIINLIESFILWKSLDRYDDVLNKLKIINFRSMEKETFEKLKIVFINVKFYSKSEVDDKNEYYKKIFF